MMHIIGSWAFDIAMGIAFVIWMRGKPETAGHEEQEQ